MTAEVLWMASIEVGERKKLVKVGERLVDSWPDQSSEVGTSMAYEIGDDFLDGIYEWGSRD